MSVSRKQRKPLKQVDKYLDRLELRASTSTSALPEMRSLRSNNKE